MTISLGTRNSDVNCKLFVIYLAVRVVYVTDNKENLVPKTYRIDPSDAEFISGLCKNKILGNSESAVVRTLLRRAIDDLIEKDFIRKHIDTLNLLQQKQRSRKK